MFKLLGILLMAGLLGYLSVVLYELYDKYNNNTNGNDNSNNDNTNSGTDTTVPKDVNK